MDDAETVICAICGQAHDPGADRPTTTYRSIVLHIKATPQRLLPERWTVDHWCNLCRQRVAPGQLIFHAQHHEHARHGLTQGGDR